MAWLGLARDGPAPLLAGAGTVGLLARRGIVVACAARPVHPLGRQERGETALVHPATALVLDEPERALPAWMAMPKADAITEDACSESGSNWFAGTSVVHRVVPWMAGLLVLSSRS